MKIKVILIILCVSTFYSSLAQKDSANFIMKTPIFSIDYYNYGKSDIDEIKGTQISMQEWKIQFQMAVPLTDKLFLTQKLEYIYFKYQSDYNGYYGDEPVVVKRDFHSTSLSLGILAILKNDWTLLANFAPGLASDFETNLHSDDFNIFGSALAIKQRNQNFRYGFGLSYTTSLGPAMVIPSISLDYRTINWETMAFLPLSITTNYVFNAKTKIGLSAAISGNMFNLTVEDPNFDFNRISFSRVNIGPHFQTRIFKDFYLNFGAGIAVGNRIFSLDDKLKEELSTNADNKFFFNVGIVLLK